MSAKQSWNTLSDYEKSLLVKQAERNFPSVKVSEVMSRYVGLK
ncbi:hypothetical protein ACI2JA_03580 [Alkalihalobacillus sp. NPDC078783]